MTDAEIDEMASNLCPTSYAVRNDEVIDILGELKAARADLALCGRALDMTQDEAVEAIPLSAVTRCLEGKGWVTGTGNDKCWWTRKKGEDGIWLISRTYGDWKLRTTEAFATIAKVEHVTLPRLYWELLRGEG